MTYDLALLIGAVWIYGTIAGVLVALVGRRWANPYVGVHRRAEDR